MLPCTAGSLCHRQNVRECCSLLLPHLIPARLRPSGKHHFCPATSHLQTQGRVTIRNLVSCDWRTRTPKGVCQQLCSQGPAPGSARAREGTAKLNWSLRHSLISGKAEMLPNHPGSLQSPYNWVPRSLERVFSSHWHLTVVQHLLCPAPCD